MYTEVEEDVVKNKSTNNTNVEDDVVEKEGTNNNKEYDDNNGEINEHSIGQL